MRALWELGEGTASDVQRQLAAAGLEFAPTTVATGNGRAVLVYVAAAWLADIEHALAELARPLISAAGMSPSRVRIMVVQDPEMNAFVLDGGHVFVNSGLIMRLGSAAELQSVFAHELAHIANGHITVNTTDLFRSLKLSTVEPG